MTARKTAKKAPAGKPKKKTGKVAKAAKTTKTASRKKAPAAARSKASPARKQSTKRAAKAVPPQTAPPPRQEATDAPRAETSSLNVNLGHVFALRPRVSTSFRQSDFHAARQRLQDESYASLAEAARAVAEKALELTHEGGAKRGGRSRR